MVEIAVERKRTSPALKWALLALAALAVIGLVAYLLAGRSSDRVDPVPGAQTAPAAAGTMDQAAFFNATDRVALAGRSADLASVTVKRVLSDRVFTVASGASSELFVMLDGRLDRGAMEQRVAIKEGQVLGLSGLVTRAPAGSERIEGLKDEDVRALRDQQVYLHANDIRPAQ